MSKHGARTEAERRFLESYDPGAFDRPSVTVDTVVFRRRGRRLEVLLIKRGGHPFKGCWALPGGFLDLEADADLVDGAARELEEETGLSLGRLVPFGTFGRRGRDPRGRTVTAAFLCLADERMVARGADDATEAAWFDVRLDDEGRAVPRRRGRPVSLAFDHDEVVGAALVELLQRASAALPLLEIARPSWTVADLVALVEAAAG